jgi:antitoxin (DNA-binding transcriptional repressor) of toxin-antitoxin stability system
MRTVGLREPKTHPSRIPREVQGDDLVLVTDRGRRVAELRVPGATARAESPIQRALGRL